MTSALRAQIADLSLAIEKQENVLLEMQKELRGLQTQLDSIPYPVSTLPPEVVSEIFIHCLPSADVPFIRSNDAPLLLAQISRNWRQIALGTPQLWSAFSIGHDGPHVGDMVQSWINRAHSCPLSFGLWGLPADNVDDFLNVFTRDSNRIRYLKIDLAPVTVEENLNFAPLDFQQLQELHVELYDELSENFVLQMFRTAPLLHTVVLNSVVTHTFMALPWQQITNFTGYARTPVEFGDALSLMPNLIRCDLGLFSGDRDQMPPPLIHTNIQKFCISDHGEWEPGIFPHMLECLTLPALRTLQLGDSDHVEGSVLDVFLKRSSPPLSKLVFSPFARTDTPFTTHFETLGLTDLAIRFPASSTMIRFLSEFSSDAGFLPRLQNLSIHCGQGKMRYINLPSVMYLAETAIPARGLTSAGLLRSLRLTSEILPFQTIDFPKHRLRPFRDLIAAGMEVHIGTETKSEV